MFQQAFQQGWDDTVGKQQATSRLQPTKVTPDGGATAATADGSAPAAGAASAGASAAAASVPGEEGVASFARSSLEYWQNSFLVGWFNGVKKNWADGLGAIAENVLEKENWLEVG